MPHAAPSNCGPPLANAEVDCVLQVIRASLAESTREVYSTGLLVFHVYCDTKNISDDQCAPISSNLFAAFLSSCAGAYSSSITNYATSIRAWHMLHGLEWKVNDIEYKSLLEGAV